MVASCDFKRVIALISYLLISFFESNAIEVSRSAATVEYESTCSDVPVQAQKLQSSHLALFEKIKDLFEKL
jgi:hypothetical protein